MKRREFITLLASATACPVAARAQRSSGPAIKALQQETRTIPLIFVEVSDPAGAGVVASLARPGGKTSGFLFYEDSILGK